MLALSWMDALTRRTALKNPMRLKSAIVLLTFFVVAFPAIAAPVAPALHEVEIPEGGITLRAQLFKPEGEGPFPTVIALHGCGGLTGHAEPVLPREKPAWLDRTRWPAGRERGGEGDLYAELRE